MELENFTEQSKLCIQGVERLARSLRHQTLYPEHLLRQILEEPNGVILKLLKHMNVNIKKILFQKRKERQRPALDDKGLTSWNAMMIKAYAKAYQVFQKEDHAFPRIFLERPPLKMLRMLKVHLCGKQEDYA